MFAETLKYISKSNNSLKEKNVASFANFIFWGFFFLYFSIAYKITTKDIYNFLKEYVLQRQCKIWEDTQNIS